MKRVIFLKIIILHCWLFLTFGYHYKGTIFNIAKFELSYICFFRVDAHLRFWYNVPLERCTLRSKIHAMKGLEER